MRKDVANFLAALAQIRACYGTPGWTEAAAELIANHLDAARNTSTCEDGESKTPGTPGHGTESVTTASCPRESPAPEKLDGAPVPAMRGTERGQQTLFAPIGRRRQKDPG